MFYVDYLLFKLETWSYILFGTYEFRQSLTQRNIRVLEEDLILSFCTVQIFQMCPVDFWNIISMNIRNVPYYIFRKILYELLLAFDN